MSEISRLVFQCPTCSSSEGVKEGTQIKCAFCGNRYRASFMDDPLFVNLQYAVNERQEAKFDLARRRYDKMIRENPEGASLEEVYWGRFLCEQYVIFYQNDLDEAIPSFWEINREHYSRSQSYQKAMEYGMASGNAENYERLAELVEVYKTKYAKVKKEFPKGYDIFICFKDSGTTDRNLGYEIYNRFSRDYEVFFSPQSLNTITGNDYEPYIYHALKTAKVLLVLCSSRDALESKWVHNEWWRFYNFSRGTDKTIIPIFRNEFEPSMLPQELKNCQGHAENVHLIATLGERFAAIFKEEATAVPAKEKRPVPSAPKTFKKKPKETKKAPVKTAPAKSAKTENATPTEKKKGTKYAILTALLLLVIGTAVGIGIFNQNGAGVTPAEYLTFEENADGTYTVIDFDDTAFTGTEVIIPATYNWGAVTSIGKGAFRNCKELTSITIPNSVTSIGDWVFSYCDSLTSIVIPNSVTSIGNWAFSDCDSLTNVYYTGSTGGWSNIDIGDLNSNLASATRYYYSETQPATTGNYWHYVDGVPTVWGEDGNATSARYFTFEENDNGGYTVTGFDKTSFTGTEVVIPATYNGGAVTSIGKGAFRICKELTSITIPDSVTSIGDDAFYNCERLTFITIPDSVTSIGYYAFRNCKELTSIAISNSVTSIGDGAFSGCYSLTKVYYIGSARDWSNISIGLGNSDLTFDTLYYYSETQPTTTGNYWHYVDGVPTVWGKDGNATSARYFTFEENDNGGYTVIDFDDTAFTGTKVVILATYKGKSVTGIGDDAFYNCERLTSITIPDSVTWIGQKVFKGCSSLTTITIPDSVTSIGDDAFYNCERLTFITIPDSVTSIGEGAFEGCDSLTYVYYTGSASGWSNISIGSDNADLTSAIRYYYSETQPTATGNYWHYVDGVPTAW